MDCYKCKHRGTLPGDVHSCCNHPIAQENPVVDFLVLNLTGTNSTLQKMGIEINSHGLRNGWANFPLNYDPIWIETCECFESK